MATAAVSAVSLPTFTGLKAVASQKANVKSLAVAPCVAPRASLKTEALNKVGQFAAAAAAATVLFANSASAITIGMGSATGALVFEPKVAEVAAGETITFVNVAGYPHNVVFDEDAIPGGVDVDAISHEDYFNGAGESWDLTLTTPGSYDYFCEPHQGAGMKAVIIVK